MQTHHTEVQARELDHNLQPYTEVLKDYFPSREEILHEAQLLTKKNQAARKRNLISTALGTVLSLLLAVLWILDPVLESNYLTTSIGELHAYNMKDGSKITLNTNSEARVDNRLFSRRVILTQGEALFNVSHGWRSFIVQANNAYIRDIGTVFNVLNIEQGAIVTVIDGSVEVTVGNKKQLLTQDQKLKTSINSLGFPVRVDSRNITAWQQGKLLFDGTPLTEAIKEMQRYRKAPITLDPQVAKLRISGVYDIQGVESLLDTLPITVPVKVNRGADGAVEIISR